MKNTQIGEALGNKSVRLPLPLIATQFTYHRTLLLILWVVGPHEDGAISPFRAEPDQMPRKKSLFFTIIEVF